MQSEPQENYIFSHPNLTRWLFVQNHNKYVIIGHNKGPTYISV